MEAYIKVIDNAVDNYARFGKVLPKVETKIDICKYFNCDIEKAKFYLAQLMNDKKLQVVPVRGASESSVKNIEVAKEKAVEINKIQTEKQETKEDILTKKIKRKLVNE